MNREKSEFGFRGFSTGSSYFLIQLKQELQRKGNTGGKGQEIADRIESFDSMDTKEPRQQKNTGNKVDPLAQA